MLASHYLSLAMEIQDESEGEEEMSQAGSSPSESVRAFVPDNPLTVTEPADAEVAPPSVASVAVPRDEGPSRKGKATDPMNWGSLSFARDWNEEDLEQQRRALANFNDIHNASARPAAIGQDNGRVVVPSQPNGPSPAPVPGQVTTPEFALLMAHISRLEKSLLEQQKVSSRKEDSQTVPDTGIHGKGQWRSKRVNHQLPRQLAPNSFIAKAIRDASRVTLAPAPTDPSDSSDSSESDGPEPSRDGYP
uniref:Uncharacterized protein n=1 Tax=Mycena chlorophos TaxID=658473 RepID=A0ABQ0L6A1_MYCCL|nr:predicted protein [Mycena chlorophos]